MNKSKIINILKILGRGYSEVIINIKLENIDVNSIELSGKDILLHTFGNNDFDYFIYYDDLSDKDKTKLEKDLLKIYLP